MPAPRILLVLFLLLVCPAQGLSAAQGPPPEDIDTLVALALANNPEVKASAERWQMIVERSRQAGALEDPMLMLRVQNALIRAPLDFQRDTMTAKVIGISQKLPFYGKRELMREEAGFEAEAERWVVEERRIELRRMVKEVWFQIYLIDRSLETVAGTILLLDDLTRLAESMYGAGKTGQQEIFQAQLERSKMEEMRINLEQQRSIQSTTLNSLLYRAPELAIPSIPKISLIPFTLSADELERLAFSRRPALKSLQARVDKAEAGTRLAEKEIYPDVTLSLEYMQREPAMDTPGDDMYGAQLTVNLPVQSARRQARIAEARAEKRMASEEWATLQNQIRLGIHTGLAQLERSRQLTRLYEMGIFDQAKGAMQSALAAYRSDKAKFSEVLTSHMALFNFEREYHGAMAQYQFQLATLENIVGAPLPSTPELSTPNQGQ
jgi:outer membrane protein, heavy metal efflux system